MTKNWSQVYPKVSKAKTSVKSKTKVDRKQDKEISRIKKLLPSTKSKYFDFTVSNQTLSYNGSLVTTLMALSRGTADNERVGDSIKMTRMDVKIASFSTGAGADNCRYTFFLDKSPYIVSTAALYKTTGSDLATLSPLQEDYRQNIVLLKDFKVPVSSAAKPVINTTFSRKLNHVVRYAGATTTPVSNYLKMAYISDALAPVAAFDAYIRVWYIDI